MNIGCRFLGLVAVAMYGAPVTISQIDVYMNPNQMEFTAQNAELYLQAERFAIVDKNYLQALVIIDGMLSSSDLNSFETYAVYQLRGGVLLGMDNPVGAARDVESSLIADPAAEVRSRRRQFVAALNLYNRLGDVEGFARIEALWIARGGDASSLATAFERRPRSNGEPNWMLIWQSEGPVAPSNDVGLPLIPNSYRGAESTPTCDVTFSSDVHGVTYDIKPRCDDRALADAAAAHVADLEFRPAMKSGREVPRIDATYTVHFKRIAVSD